MTTKLSVRAASMTLRMAAVLAALTVGTAAAQRPVPLPIEGVKPVAGRALMPVGPPPAGVIVTGTPAQARVAWQPTPGVSGYSVLRWKQADPNCCRAQSPVLPASANSWNDPVQWSGTWVYRVTALYPNNAPGFVDVSYQYPEPQIPAGFKAEQTGEGTVTLSWQPVANASYYVLAGPPTNQSMTVNGTSATVPGVPTGNMTWQLGSIYDADGVHRAGSALTSTSLNVVRRSGRYRLWVEQLRVNEQTYDPNSDGHGDEVYVSAYVQMMDRRNGALLQAATVRSAIHGDVFYWPAPARAQFGTASPYGGLKTGDVIPVVGQATAGPGGWPLFVLWEGVLTDGIDEILVWPVLWESEDLPAPFQEWNQIMQRDGPSLLANPAVVAEAATAGLKPVLAPELSLYIRVSGNIVAAVTNSVVSADRPIGMRLDQYKAYLMQRVVLVITREKIEASLASPTFGGLQPGVIPVVLADSPDSSAGLGGSYTVYLRVERIP